MPDKRATELVGGNQLDDEGMDERRQEDHRQENEGQTRWQNKVAEY
jgi:hypothetical protein